LENLTHNCHTERSRSATDNQQPTTLVHRSFFSVGGENQQQKTNNRKPTTENQQQKTDNRQP